MGCGCNGDKAKEPEPQYEVKYPNGEKKVVAGLHEAKVAATLGPVGTSYSKI